jgi:hypothetical protein
MLLRVKSLQILILGSICGAGAGGVLHDPEWPLRIAAVYWHCVLCARFAKRRSAGLREIRAVLHPRWAGLHGTGSLPVHGTIHAKVP